MPSNYPTFANDIKFRSQFGPYLIRIKVKTASPLFALSIWTCLTFDALNYKISLYQS